MIAIISIKNKATKARNEVVSHGFECEKISFYAQELRDEIHNIEVKGLCMGRFTGDLITKGDDYSDYRVGDRLKIGEATIEITQTGKACHASDCRIFDKEKPCIMQKGILFGQVITPGKISIKDEMEKIQ